MNATAHVPDARERLLAGIPVVERRLAAAGIATAALEGGDGPAVVLLHGPGEHAAKWFSVLPALLETNRVIAPDLPGHGATAAPADVLDAERVLAWLDALIESCCTAPPLLLGHIVGGAIAARYAARHPQRIRGLVLVDALGLVPFRPAPEFERVLMDYLAQPGADTHDRLWQRCAFDLDGLRTRLGARWAWLKAYNLDRIAAPGAQSALQALMHEFGFPAIAGDEVARIAVPTTLVWGRHDLATRLQVAQTASARYGWPLHIIENAADDPAMEQPAAFVAAVRAADRSASAATATA